MLENSKRTRLYIVYVIILCFLSVIYNLYFLNDSLLLAIASSFQQSPVSHEDFMSTTADPRLDAKALQMKRDVKILCWILTSPKYHTTRARAVKDTWGKRCNKLIFISTETDDVLGSVALQVEDGYNMLWPKTREAFKLLFDQYLHDYEWFFKADDDTYAIMENLRYMLTPYSPEYPIAFGSRYSINHVEYLSGGAGYVLSREALRRYGTYAYNNSKICEPSQRDLEEDVHITRCLVHSGVLLGDSRDSFGYGRFHHFNARDVIRPGSLPQWHHDRITFEQGKGIENLSEVAVSFHWLSPEQLYEMEYLLYKLRPVGVLLPDMSLPAPLPPDNKSIPEEVLVSSGRLVVNSTNATRLKQKINDSGD